MKSETIHDILRGIRYLVDEILRLVNGCILLLIQWMFFKKPWDVPISKGIIDHFVDVDHTEPMKRPQMYIHWNGHLELVDL